MIIFSAFLSAYHVQFTGEPTVFAAYPVEDCGNVVCQESQTGRLKLSIFLAYI